MFNYSLLIWIQANDTSFKFCAGDFTAGKYNMLLPVLQNWAKRELDESQKKTNPSHKWYNMDLKRRPYLFVPVFLTIFS